MNERLSRHGEKMTKKNFELPLELLERIRAKARLEKTNDSNIIRKAIEVYLDTGKN